MSHSKKVNPFNLGELRETPPDDRYIIDEWLSVADRVGLSPSETSALYRLVAKTGELGHVPAEDLIRRGSYGFIYDATGEALVARPGADIGSFGCLCLACAPDVFDPDVLGRRWQDDEDDHGPWSLVLPPSLRDAPQTLRDSACGCVTFTKASDE